MGTNLYWNRMQQLHISWRMQQGDSAARTGSPTAFVFKVYSETFDWAMVFFNLK